MSREIWSVGRECHIVVVDCDRQRLSVADVELNVIVSFRQRFRFALLQDQAAALPVINLIAYPANPARGLDGYGDDLRRTLRQSCRPSRCLRGGTAASLIPACSCSAESGMTSSPLT